MQPNLVSICMAAYGRPSYLDRALLSIYRQDPPFPIEVIVVDDGSPTGTVAQICNDYPLVRYTRVERGAVWRNPAAARNVAYRQAMGDVIVAQSADVEHQGNAIKELIEELEPGSFVLANVFNTGWYGRLVPCHGNWIELVGPNGRARRPLFFLGAVYRQDLYAVGGCEELFTAPSRDDQYFGECLINGRQLQPKYSTQAIGHHLDHPRPRGLDRLSQPSQQLYQRLIRAKRWIATGGPWPDP